MKQVLSIVIPVYNEAKTLRELISHVKKSDTLGMKKEILVVNDASFDGTDKILRQIPGITVLSHKKNQGKGAALKTGFLQASGDFVLVQDADFEYSPEDYPRLLEPFLKHDADALIGTRFRGSEARRVIYFSHEIANHFLTFFSNLLTNFNLTDMECGYKVFKREILLQFADKLSSKRFGIEPEIVARLAKIPGIKLYEVGVRYQGRTYQEGKKISVVDGIKALFQIVYFAFFSR